MPFVLRCASGDCGVQQVVLPEQPRAPPVGPLQQPLQPLPPRAEVSLGRVHASGDPHVSRRAVLVSVVFPAAAAGRGEVRVKRIGSSQAFLTTVSGSGSRGSGSGNGNGYGDGTNADGLPQTHVHTLTTDAEVVMRPGDVLHLTPDAYLYQLHWEPAQVQPQHPVQLPQPQQAQSQSQAQAALKQQRQEQRARAPSPPPAAGGSGRLDRVPSLSSLSSQRSRSASESPERRPLLLLDTDSAGAAAGAAAGASARPPARATADGDAAVLTLSRASRKRPREQQDAPLPLPTPTPTPPATPVPTPALAAVAASAAARVSARTYLNGYVIIICPLRRTEQGGGLGRLPSVQLDIWHRLGSAAGAVVSWDSPAAAVQGARAAAESARSPPIKRRKTPGAAVAGTAALDTAVAAATAAPPTAIDVLALLGPKPATATASATAAAARGQPRPRISPEELEALGSSSSSATSESEADELQHTATAAAAARAAAEQWMAQLAARTGTPPTYVLVVDASLPLEDLQAWWGVAPLPFAANNVPALSAERRLFQLPTSTATVLSSSAAAASASTQQPSPLSVSYVLPRWLMQTFGAKRAVPLHLFVWSALSRSGRPVTAVTPARACGLIPLSAPVAAALQGLQASSGRAFGAGASASSDVESVGVAAPDELQRRWQWVRAQAPDLPSLYALGDDASRWGGDLSQPPVACPFTREQILKECGTVLQLSPWLQVVVPFASREAAAAHASTTAAAAQTAHGRSGGDRYSGRYSRVDDDDSEDEDEDNIGAASGGAGAQLGGGAGGDGAAARVQVPGHDGEHSSSSSDDSSHEDDGASGRSSTAAAAGTAAAGTAAAGTEEDGEKRWDLNRHLTGPLSQLSEIYRVMEGHPYQYKADTLDRVVAGLRSLPFKVRGPADAKRARAQVRGMGAATEDKVMEILRTGTLERLRKLQQDPQLASLRVLTKVLWAGPVAARKWYALGYRTVQDLVAAAARGHGVCTHNQLVGLKYYDELQQRIAREESARIARVVGEAVQRVLPGSLCVLGGSYRRGSATSSDADFILCPPRGYGTVNLLPALYRYLKGAGYLTDDLLISFGQRGGGAGGDSGSGGGGDLADSTAPHDDLSVGHDPFTTAVEDIEPCDDLTTGQSAGTYFGIWQDRQPRDAAATAASSTAEAEAAGAGALSAAATAASSTVAVGLHRRIDLKCFHHTQAAYALFAWTGNTPLSRSLRHYVSLLGYHLDARCLVPRTGLRADAEHVTAHGHVYGAGGPAGGAGAKSRLSFQKQLSKGKIASAGPCVTEFDLFSFCGLRFIPPQHRNVVPLAGSDWADTEADAKTERGAGAGGSGSGSEE